MFDDDAKKQISARLSRIGGQLDGIRRMVNEPRLCVEVLQQVASVEAAIRAVADLIIRFHLERCLVESLHKDDPDLEAKTRELMDIVTRYLRR